MTFRFNLLYFLVLGFCLSLTSCFDFVEDGLEIEYADSEASLSVVPIGSTLGAVNETLSLAISVDSEFDIKSCIISTSNEGKNGSGFNVSDPDFDDPFADHIYGTVKPGIKSFKVRYDYIIPDAINKSRITVTIIDGSGKVKTEQTINVVPGISRKNGLELYAKNTIFHDALSSSEGIVYENIKSNYSSFSQENVDVQKKIDIVFYFNPNNNRTSIASTAAGSLDYELSVENSMVFKKVLIPSALNFDDLTASDVANIVEAEELITTGKLDLGGIVVGDMIGFIADVNAVNSLKAGILRVEGLHPASVPRYEGLSYVMKCSVITQI